MPDLFASLPPRPYLPQRSIITWVHGRQVRVSHDPPPGPGWEKMAWQAVFDDSEGKPVGYGATPAEALDDLREIDA